MLLKEKIPTIYHTFLTDFLDLEIPNEDIATCSSCTLCKSDKSPYLDIKCCNYFPQMPNFLLGGILKENEFEFGKKQIKSIIKSKVGTTPYGILPGKKFTLRQNEVLKKKELFNTKQENADQKCPYYDHGRCSVWKYRESLCVTFYCSSIGGKNGDDFWAKLNGFLKLVEQKLSQYALLKLNWDSTLLEVKELKTESFDFENLQSKVNKEKFNNLWQDWAGKEEELYLKSYSLIQELSREEFISIMGLDYEIYKLAIFKLAETFNANRYPEFLRLNPKVIFEPQNNGKLKLRVDEQIVTIDLVFLPFIKKFNGTNNTVHVFHLAFKVLLSLNPVVDKLVKAKMLEKQL